MKPSRANDIITTFLVELIAKWNKEHYGEQKKYLGQFSSSIVHYYIITTTWELIQLLTS